jgi:glycosyltransferase involved in cell wall biosynthesis
LHKIRRTVNYETRGNKTTKISIGITCFNNGDNIHYLLNDIEHQELRSGVQIEDVTVVASGCADNTVLSVREFVKRDPRIHLVIESHRNGKPSAINKILDSISGEVLVLLSGDVRLPNASFVDNLASYCTNGVGVVGCRPVPINDIRTKAGYMGHLMWNLHDRTLDAQIENGLRMQAGEAFAIRRQAAEYVPLDVINDDAYLVLRAQLKGQKFVYARQTTVLNRTAESSSDVLLQRARIIRGHRQLKQMIGVSPSVLDTLIFRRPPIVAAVVYQEIRDQLEAGELRVHWFLELILLELTAHLLSKIWNTAALWPTSKSAKWSQDESERASRAYASGSLYR